MAITMLRKKVVFKTLNMTIDALLEKFPDMKIILGGDFNITVNDDVDRWASSHKENSLMIDFMNERGLIDMWRVSNPNTKEFTWKNKSGSLQLRIDMWIISESLSYSDCKVEITLTPLMDHKAILLTLNMSHRVHKKTSAY